MLPVDKALPIDIAEVAHVSAALRRWLAQHVRLRSLPESLMPQQAIDNKGTTQGVRACTFQAKDGVHYVIFRDDLPTLPGAERHVLLMHELGHVTRGDCLPRSRQVMPDGRRRAIAQDACINHALPQDAVRSLGGVTYERVRQEAPALPARPPGAKPIYDALQGNEPPPQGACGGAACESGADATTQAQAHARAVLELRVTPEGMEGGELHGMAAGVGTADRRTAAPAPKPAPWIECIMRKVRGKRTGTLARERSHSRPGRVRGLRGVRRRERLRILVGVDVSGSFAHAWQHAAALARWLGREHACETVVWATQVEKWRPGTEARVGGGTKVQALWRHAQALRADLVVCITDGQIMDAMPLPAAPVAWVLPPQGRPPVPPREQDSVVNAIGANDA